MQVLSIVSIANELSLLLQLLLMALLNFLRSQALSLPLGSLNKAIYRDSMPLIPPVAALELVNIYAYFGLFAI